MNKEERYFWIYFLIRRFFFNKLIFDDVESFFDFVYQEITQLPADTNMNIAMNISDIPTIPVELRFSKTISSTLHLYVIYLIGIFKKDLPNLVISKTIEKVGLQIMHTI